MKKMHGVITAMVTPFTGDDQVDVKTLKAYTDYLIGKSVHCLYPAGTTGEMLKMSAAERKLVAETVVRQAAGRATVYIHAGAMTTKETVELAKHAHSIGADGIGVVTPQFFCVNDREMEEFFVAVSQSVPDDFPVYAYCIPQCAANDLRPEIIEKILKRTKNIVGVKYSYPDFLRVKNYLLCNNGGFSVVVGTDRLFLAGLVMGCDGTVSGCSNADPSKFVETYQKFKAGDLEGARAAQALASELCEITGNGANMAIFKYALERHGLPSARMRAPALDLTDEEKKALAAKLEVYERKL
ncbi:MAG: dihydrodipicolinate synthase family protein [Spirochaetales bacterium]|jgi:4-hydroxy-tetrahydrodipicolinate synthase|nr:dihydrodipicolinate synthase family protein [Spirochaetales bacterium]